jgi:hypothetical protein
MPVMRIHLERQITVAIENQPGQLARVSELLAGRSVNIEAIAVIDSIEQGVIRLITSDPQLSRQLLREAGFYVIEGDVLVLDVTDKIGRLAQVSAALAQAKINIDYVYGSSEHAGQPMRLVLKISDLARAREILEPLQDS